MKTGAEMGFLQPGTQKGKGERENTGWGGRAQEGLSPPHPPLAWWHWLE